MTVIELIKQDFEKVFPSILKNDRVELDSEDIMEAPNSYNIQQLKEFEGVKSINEDERISLLNFINLMDEAEVLLDYDEEINQRLLQYIDKYPGLKSFEFFHIFYRLMHFVEGGLDKDGLEEYYRSIIEIHPELVKLEDFIARINFHVPLLLIENPSSDLIELLHEYYSLFPEKAIIKSLLGRMHELIGDLEKAIEYHLQFLCQIESDRVYNKAEDILEFTGDGITIEDFHLTLSNLTRLFYQNDDFEHALEYSQKCLNEFNIQNEDVYSFQVLFLDPLITKLRILIKRNSIKGFKQNYELLWSKVDPKYLKELDIPDIKEYAKNMKA